MQKRFALIAVFALSALALHAQVHGVPPSVLSPAPGRSFAPPASVTSLGPRGYNVGPAVLGHPGQKRFGGGINTGRGHHGRGRGFGGGFIGGGYVYYAPYAVPVWPYLDNTPSDIVIDPATGQEVSTERSVVNYSDSSESRQYRPPVGSYQDAGTSNLQTTPQPVAPTPLQQSASTLPEAPIEPQPTTVLVFKDGHQLEITNYAIQGSTLFNFSGKGPRRIRLAELNVPETIRRNDDNGIEFSIPNTK